MTIYNAPLQDINFLLNNFFNVDNQELVSAVTEEAAKFATGVLSPINHSGDRQGCVLKDSEVITPKGFKEAYAEFIKNGWNSVPFPESHGGQGLSWLVSTAISEMWSGANMAFALCPLLTQGSVELLLKHGRDEQKAKYLPNLISGNWTGTMCLTEPQAGSDVGAVKTSAVKNGEHYLIKGQKIFITYGEHDFSENIIHMVLARLPDAPKGTKGISLFIVPKFLEDGTRNDLKAISIEHKMGINASPTAVMAFGDEKGAVGYLVGEENCGLKYMFTMMNNARLAVGVEGIAIAQNSLQQAEEYAKERVQAGVAIINHADVKRMLLTIRANTESMRALAYYAAKTIDNKQKKITDLLIPVLKAHATDIGFDMSSMAVQVFGGLGFIEETGIAQNLRDAKIAQIYEGTNGIQAMDLVTRKIMADAALAEFISDIKPLYEGGLYNNKINLYIEKLEKATEKMRNVVLSDTEKAGFIAYPYLKMFGTIAGAIMLAACEKSLGNEQSEYAAQKRETVKFYMDYILPFADVSSWLD